MAIIEDEIADAWYGEVKRKKNTTRNLSARPGKVARVAGAAPEVMVKITGYGKGAAHVKEHMNYISRNGKIELEDENGELFKGKQEVMEKFALWSADMGKNAKYPGQRDTMHIVLSMPEGTPGKDVKIAVREFAKDTFGKSYPYVMALHEDTRQPHVHLTVKTLANDSHKRLHANPEDIQEWRERFAEKMRDRGIDAEATPRSVRGVVQKAEKNVIRHIERGDKTHKPRVSKVRANKVREVVNEIQAEANGQAIPAKPWENKIRATQERVRGAWLQAADKLDQVASDEALKFAARIKAFVAKMPAVQTEREAMKQMLAKMSEVQRHKHLQDVQQTPTGEKKGVDKATPRGEDNIER